MAQDSEPLNLLNLPLSSPGIVDSVFSRLDDGPMLLCVVDLAPHGDGFVLALVCKAFYNAVIIRYKKLSTPSAGAVSSVERLSWVYALPSDRPPWWGQKLCSLIAREGHLDVLKWVRDSNCAWDAKTCSDAAAGGHLEVNLLPVRGIAIQHHLIL